MLKKILPIMLALSVLLTACGAKATEVPTLPPEAVQGTAVAAAFTMVAQTQAAIPTATPLPPTETPAPTPLPTFTLAPLPTLDPITLPTNTPIVAGANDCNRALNMAEAGPTKNVRIENNTGSQVNLSLNLWKPNLFGQCGSLGFVIQKNQKIKIVIPSGYWFAYSWVQNPPSTGEVNFYLGPSGTQDLLRLVIKKDSLAWIGP